MPANGRRDLIRRLMVKLNYCIILYYFSLSYDRSIIKSKASWPQIATSCFLFQLPFSLRFSRSCLCLFHSLNVPSFFPSIFPAITYFKRQSLQKMWPIQIAECFIEWRMLLSSGTVMIIFLIVAPCILIYVEFTHQQVNFY